MRPPFLALVFLVLGIGCNHETFDLLPPAAEGAAAGVSNGGTSSGGRNGTGGFGPPTGGRGGSAGPTGGRGGPGPLPEPDCPDSQPDCQPCGGFPNDCPFGTFCDLFRSYCAPYCGPGFDGMMVPCSELDLPACDRDRQVCVECTSDPHCGPDECDFGKCVPRTPPECFNNEQCTNPSEPICFDGNCRPCTADFQCGQLGVVRCSVTGRCEPVDGPPMP